MGVTDASLLGAIFAQRPKRQSLLPIWHNWLRVLQMLTFDGAFVLLMAG